MKLWVDVSHMIHMQHSLGSLAETIGDLRDFSSKGEQSPHQLVRKHAI